MGAVASRKNGTRGAPQLRQPLPRRRPAVHVQHEVDDRDVMTDLGPRPHRSTRFTRPGPMEKKQRFDSALQPKLCPRVKIGDPGGAPSVRNGPQWHGAIGRRKLRMDFSLKKVRSTQTTRRFRDRPERPDVFKYENNSNFCPRCLSKQKVGWMRGRKGGNQVGVIGRRGEASSFSRRGG